MYYAVQIPKNGFSEDKLLQKQAEIVRVHIRVKVGVKIHFRVNYRVNNDTVCYKYLIYNQCVL